MTRITIGVTVNLQNYENLKVEVEGEDGEHLLGVLDNILGSLGRNDDHARTAIDSYRRRVLGVTETPEVKKTAPYVRKAERGDPNKCGKCGRSSSDTPQPKIAFLDGGYICSDCYKASKAPAEETVTCTSPLPAAAPPKAVAEPVAEPVAKAKVPAPPPKVPAPADTGATCDACGAVISAAEERTSRLFFSKNLCRQCLMKAEATDEAKA